MNRTIALVVLLILSASMSLYEAYQNQLLTSNYSQLSSSNSQLVSTYNSLFEQYVNISSSFNPVNKSLQQYQYMYNELLGNYSRTEIIYRSPATNQSVTIWTVHQTIAARGYIAWDVLDTFDNHIQVHTSAPTRFLLMTIFEFASFFYGKPYKAVLNSTGTEFSTDVHISQGCGVYVFVIINLESSPTIIYPNITATYAPTPFLTGVCSLP